MVAGNKRRAKKGNEPRPRFQKPELVALDCDLGTPETPRGGQGLEVVESRLRRFYRRYHLELTERRTHLFFAYGIPAATRRELAGLVRRSQGKEQEQHQQRCLQG